ncbi:hypothetical protein [Dyella sp.]|jgi:hypothetical protein|uniref:hypothetical protein n=1 Tax=Dyella sp. TaxID=1869338 RepID=UPI002D77156D|nr:hypothetical protein [Dyella sp.]HET6433732.1 hypothetical protein [Dyella sp.]
MTDCAASPDRLPPHAHSIAPVVRAVAAGTLDGPHATDADHGDWRITLHALDVAATLPAAEPGMTDQRIVALDAPVQMHCGDTTTDLLRLQLAAAPPACVFRTDTATRLVRLQSRVPQALELIARPLQGPMLLPAHAHWLAWLLAGRAQWQHGDARAELTLDEPTWLPADGMRLRIDGGGELLLLRLGTP